MMGRKTMTMEDAVNLAGEKPEWGNYVCRTLTGVYMWVDKGHAAPQEDGSFMVAASCGNSKPTYYNVEGLEAYVHVEIRIPEYNDLEPLSLDSDEMKESRKRFAAEMRKLMG